MLLLIFFLIGVIADRNRRHSAFAQEAVEIDRLAGLQVQLLAQIRIQRVIQTMKAEQDVLPDLYAARAGTALPVAGSCRRHPDVSGSARRYASGRLRRRDESRPTRSRLSAFDVIVKSQAIAGPHIGRQPADFHMSGSEHRFPSLEADCAMAVPVRLRSSHRNRPKASLHHHSHTFLTSVMTATHWQAFNGPATHGLRRRQGYGHDLKATETQRAGGAGDGFDDRRRNLLLPQNMAASASAGAILIGWAITAVGMLTLAFVFQSLANRKPELDAGVYAYAKAGFGDYMGFSSAWGYWISARIGNVSYFVLLFSTLGYFVPMFGEGNTAGGDRRLAGALGRAFPRSARYPRGGVRQPVTTIAKIVPLILFIVITAVAFRTDVFTADFWGRQPGAGQRDAAGTQHDAGDGVGVHRYRGRQRVLGARRAP